MEVMIPNKVARFYGPQCIYIPTVIAGTVPNCEFYYLAKYQIVICIIQPHTNRIQITNTYTYQLYIGVNIFVFV